MQGPKGDPGAPAVINMKEIEDFIQTRIPGSGSNGEKGAKGDQGEKGDTGARGDTGLPGINGADGLIGPVGPTGLKVGLIHLLICPEIPLFVSRDLNTLIFFACLFFLHHIDHIFLPAQNLG